MKKILLAVSIAAVAVGCASFSESSVASVAKPRAEGVYTTGRDIAFKLAFAPYTYHKYDFDQILAFAAMHDVHYSGIKYFMVNKNVKVDDPASVRAITDAEIAAFRAKMDKAGVKISSIGPVYMNTTDQCDAAFEFAQRVGVDLVVAVPYEQKPGDKKRYASRALCEYASRKCAATGIRYAIHNHGPDMPELFPTGRSAYEMIKDLDPHMGLCLDIGHDFRFGYDPVDSIHRYGSRIWDIHLKNVSDCTKKGHAMQFPRGKIDMVEVVRALKDIHYAGPLEIEYERDFTDNVQGMAESVGYFRGLMDAAR